MQKRESADKARQERIKAIQSRISAIETETERQAPWCLRSTADSISPAGSTAATRTTGLQWHLLFACILCVRKLAYTTGTDRAAGSSNRMPPPVALDLRSSCFIRSCSASPNLMPEVQDRSLGAGAIPIYRFTAVCAPLPPAMLKQLLPRKSANSSWPSTTAISGTCGPCRNSPNCGQCDSAVSNLAHKR